ncbi:acyl-CoA dehydrogenase family protein [Ramlibacter solisilvae]|uniref:Acyl-CoA dehydrogenase n=1 Tax=Ramlibacter tataouinensis TaxID=94132 RepID=A0A127JVD8_9BURK|nr:acyl-CoA dehydrogenase family protein [Ramlibacter tataouinensis]AMO23884.1 acyl-CoA dehydrogenase [Ramlibacter tataouinensis]
MNADLKADLAALTDTVRRFTLERIVPNVDAWEKAGLVPRELHREAAALGLLGLGYPEELGGTPAPYALRHAVSVTMARHSASGGVMAALFSHNIGLPPVLRHDSAELQREIIPPVLRGERIAALAITEPGCGSDVASLRTRARLDGAEWVIDGEKVFITSGMRADWITMAVRTGEAKGASGISMIVVPGDAAGLSRTALDKMGWLASDTAHLRLDGVRVPARLLVGEQGAGFKIVMSNFNGERLGMSALALGFAQACFDEALDWARQRQAFGGALIDKPVIRHKLVDMQMRIRSTEAWLATVTQLADEGKLESDPDCVAQVCMLKNHATQAMQFCADQAVQILGGMGFMRGTRSERVYREVKVMMIGGGAEEIMKELAARQLGL